jgi:eukaryotic-like serine/threonine-protein kinase
MIGKTFGPYEILAPIGAGGMGEVWKARDTRLGRMVAIKKVKEQHSERFKQEARSIAALNHPNICQLFDIGPDYLILEYVEGKPLSSPLPEKEAVRLAIQIATALEEAHQKGIIHRDLKPSNIMVTDKGSVKLLDFGLAKLYERDASSSTLATTDFPATQAGAVLGTIAYMSPEQAQGQPADARSDIFSFGLVLYEMLSGRRAFTGDSNYAVTNAIIKEEPPPLQASTSFEKIVRRCLAKQPSGRYQAMSEVKTALEQVFAEKAPPSPAEPQPSIAVLPFADMSLGKDNEWFGDGLAEEIINALTQIQGLNVAARTSAFAFRGKEQDITKIAETLHVRTILEGSVRKAGNRIRVTAQLVNAADGYHLWSQRYDREMTDVFDIQDEIARAISERLKVTLTERARRATSNPEAYELYLRGCYHWNQRSPAILRYAIQCFEQAIKLDPQYALAYAGLADCYGILRTYGWISAKDSRETAHAAITQAMALAPSLWEVNFSRAIYAFYFERAWREAGQYFQKAIEINPRSSLSQAYYGLFLATDRRTEEAVERVTLACQMDPLSALIHGLAASTLYSLARYEAAERAAHQALELQPDHLFGLWVRGLALSGLGRHEEAIDTLERAVILARAPCFIGMLGLVYARAGRLDDASRLLHELEDRSSRGEYVGAVALLAFYIGRGELPAIRTALAKVLEEDSPPYSVLATGGKFLEAFRSDPDINRMLFELYGW